MAGPYLLLGRTRLVLDYFEFVRASQRKDGNIPFAIFTGNTRPGGCLRGLKYPDDVFTYKPPKREGLPASSQETRKWIGLFEHWQTKAYPLSTLAPVCYMLTAAEIFDATGSQPWLKERLGSVEAAAKYLLTRKSQRADRRLGVLHRSAAAGRLRRRDAVLRRPRLPRTGEAVPRGRRQASEAAWSGHADKLAKTFMAAFWREDHFGEYVHPEHGLVDSHGLSDVNWAAVAFGVADGRKLERLWPRLMGEPAFWVGDMPTQLVTKPFTYEKWESTSRCRCHRRPAQRRGRDGAGLVSGGHGLPADESPRAPGGFGAQSVPGRRKTAAIGASAIILKPDGTVSPDGSQKYCEYAAVLVRVVFGNREAFYH